MKTFALPVSENVRTLAPYSSARSVLKGEGWCFMDANESPLEINLDAALPGNLNRYPDPTSDALRSALSAFYGVATDAVIAANGTDELIDLCVRSFVRRGKSVLTITPTYGMYAVSAAANGVRCVSVPLREDGALDVGQLESLFSQADLLFLCNPNNPTGAAFPPAIVKRIADTFEGVVVVDEAYGEFADIQNLPSAIERVKAGAVNVLVLRTFSKAFAAAGIRLGYGIGNRRIVDVLMKLKPPYNVNAVSQAAGLHLWSQRRAMETNARSLLAAKDTLSRECERLGCRTFPSVTHFFLFEPPGNITDSEIYNRLRDNDRIVLRRFSSPTQLANQLRVTVGTTDQNKRLVDALGAIISEAV